MITEAKTDYNLLEWKVIIWITEFLDFIYRLVFRNTAMFRKPDLFPSSGERVGWLLLSWIRYKELTSSAGPHNTFYRTQDNKCLATLSFKDGNRISLQNVKLSVCVFIRAPTSTTMHYILLTNLINQAIYNTVKVLSQQIYKGSNWS
jgi:hypothetical protein